MSEGTVRFLRSNPCMALGSTSLRDVYMGYATHLVRAPAIATCLFFLLQPFYNSLYTHGSQYMSDRLFFTLFLWSIRVSVYWTVNIFFFCLRPFRLSPAFQIATQKAPDPIKSAHRQDSQGSVVEPALDGPARLLLCGCAVVAEGGAVNVIRRG